MRLLITGASGLVGGRLALLLGTRHSVAGTRHAAPIPPGIPALPCDLLERASLEAALEASRADVVVHAAALADVDRCEADHGAARRANTEATLELARLCRARGVRLVTLSTDLVFDGSRASWSEADPVRPILTYGRTKLAAEEATLAESPDFVVLRLALVLGRGFGARATASEGILWALGEGRPVRLFTDQYRTPVDPESLAEAIARVLEARGSGLYHLGGPERLSRYELGLRVARAFGLAAGRIEPAAQAKASIGVARPADVSLDSSRARRELGWQPRPVNDAIRESRAAAG